MDKKKILIVSAVFYPANSPRANRATELAKEFAREGHDVVVLTPRNEQFHPEFENKFGIKIKDLGMPKWKPVAIKGGGVVSIARRMVSRLSKIMLEYPAIEYRGMVKRALKNESGYDLMISIAVPYPVHWGVAKVRTSNNPVAKVWVADCGDPYMGSENDTFKPAFYFKYLEKDFCKKADFLAVPTEGSVQGYYPKFHHKIKVIPQGFDFNEIELPEYVGNKVPTFVYPGLFIQGRRDPSEFLEYLVSSDKDFRFHIYTKKSELVKPFLKRGNGRIILHDFIPRAELLKTMATMDFVVNFENVGQKQTPSKLIDFAIIKKPILSVKTKALDKKTVDEFLEGNYSGQYIIKDVEQYKIENVCAKFLKLAEC
jgi:hypothetical protein